MRSKAACTKSSTRTCHESAKEGFVLWSRRQVSARPHPSASALQNHRPSRRLEALLSLPGQGFAVLVPEGAAGLQGQAIDAGEQTLCRDFWADLPTTTDHF